MGYFANGTEGMDYDSEYCERCVHSNGCAVMEAHMLYNYDECNNKNSILDLLIPRKENGIGNEKCRMLCEKDNG